MFPTQLLPYDLGHVSLKSDPTTMVILVLFLWFLALSDLILIR